jgi:hypothetical protein
MPGAGERHHWTTMAKRDYALMDEAGQHTFHDESRSTRTRRDEPFDGKSHRES